MTQSFIHLNMTSYHHLIFCSLSLSLRGTDSLLSSVQFPQNQLKSFHLEAEQPEQWLSLERGSSLIFICVFLIKIVSRLSNVE